MFFIHKGIENPIWLLLSYCIFKMANDYYRRLLKNKMTNYIG
jgi:hypothetical protein